MCNRCRAKRENAVNDDPHKTAAAWCAYCAARASVLDHVTPHAAASSRSDGRRYSRRICVPACAECNLLLGDKMLTRVGERAKHLAGRLRARHAALVSMPEWSASELAELGRAMRDIVDASLTERRAVLARIEQCERVAEMSPDISDVWAAVDESGGLL